MCLFLSEFDVEGDSQECPDNSDYAQVFNGLASWSPIIGRYCGSVIPSSIESKTNKLRIEFRSNSQYAGRGFDAVFTVESDVKGIDNYVFLKTVSLDNVIQKFSLVQLSWYMSHYTILYKNGKPMRKQNYFSFLYFGDVFDKTIIPLALV